MGYPFSDAANHFQGVVFAILELERLGNTRSALSEQLPKGASWTEIDRNGTIVSRYPAADLSTGQTYPDRTLLSTVLRQPDGIVERSNLAGRPCFLCLRLER